MAVPTRDRQRSMTVAALRRRQIVISFFNREMIFFSSREI